MNRPRVDYNQLAPTYHARYNEGQLDGIAEALRQMAEACSADVILEVGCGTGKWIEVLRATGASVFGADASTGMLAEARKRLGATLLLAARANDLPFTQKSFDLIHCVNALHHFDDPQSFIGEAAALLKPGGWLLLIGIDPRANRRRYHYHYFENTFETDLHRYPSFGQLVDWTSAAGLENVELRIVETAAMSFTGRSIFQDPFLAKESNSMLALLTDEAYDAGLQRIRVAVAASEASGEPLEFRSELAFGMISGRRRAAPE